MTVDPQNWLMPYDGAVQTRPATLRSPQKLLAWAGSSTASATQRRKGKRPAAASPPRSRNRYATDRHLHRCDPRTHGGTRAIYRALCLPANSKASCCPAAGYTAGLVSGPGRPFRPRAEERRSPTRSSLAGPVVPPSISVATSATRRRESRARLRSTSKAVTASRR
jgi:hypothetical protein